MDRHKSFRIPVWNNVSLGVQMTAVIHWVNVIHGTSPLLRCNLCCDELTPRHGTISKESEASPFLSVKTESSSWRENTIFTGMRTINAY